MQARQEILRVHTKKTPLDKVDLQLIAEQTDRFSGADLENLCREVGVINGCWLIVGWLEFYVLATFKVISELHTHGDFIVLTGKSGHWYHGLISHSVTLS